MDGNTQADATNRNDSETSRNELGKIRGICSRRVRYEIIDALNRRHGPYKTLAAARAHIEKRFRFQAQDDERSGRYPIGWDIGVVQPKTARRQRARQ